MNPKRLYIAGILIAALPFVAAAGPVIASGPPDGSISGIPGSTVGWGFTVQADPTDWVSFVTSLTLFESNPSLGFYTDFIGFQGGPVDFVLPPASPDWTQSFDATAETGLGSYTIDPSALPGAVDSGSIHIEYQLFSDDPNTCGACSVGSGSADLPFQVTVVPTPEPASWYLLAAGIGLLASRRRKKE